MACKMMHDCTGQKAVLVVKVHSTFSHTVIDAAEQLVPKLLLTVYAKSDVNKTPLCRQQANKVAYLYC